MNEMKEEQEELSTLMIRQKFFLLKNHSQRFFFCFVVYVQKYIPRVIMEFPD